MSRGVKSILIFAAFVVIFTLSRHALGKDSSTTTTTTTSATTTSVTSTTVATVSCDASDFSGTYNEGEGAAGTIYASVTVTKNTAGTCTLNGWPLLTLQDKFGAVLRSTLVNEPTAGGGFAFQSAQANNAPANVVLTQNVGAMFSLAYSDVQAGSTACENAATLNVQFVTGGPSIAVTPAYPLEPCNNGQVWVSPFY